MLSSFYRMLRIDIVGINVVQLWVLDELSELVQDLRSQSKVCF